MLYIALTAILPTYSALRRAMDTAKGDNGLLSPSETERERAIVIPRIKAVLGALRDCVVELLGEICLAWTKDAVSSSAPPVTCCELAWNESYE